MEDKRNILRDEKPFDYKILKGEKAQIFFKNKVIKIIMVKDFSKLQKKIDGADAYELQLFLATVTGQFKHENEKQNKKKLRCR